MACVTSGKNRNLAHRLPYVYRALLTASLLALTACGDDTLDVSPPFSGPETNPPAVIPNVVDPDTITARGNVTGTTSTLLTTTTHTTGTSRFQATAQLALPAGNAKPAGQRFHHTALASNLTLSQTTTMEQSQ